MFKIFKAPIANFRSNIKNIKLDGAELTLMLLFVATILTANIIRVVNDAEKNYGIYLYEVNKLEELASDIEDLEREYEFSASEEAKILQAREILNSTAENGELIKVANDPGFYEVNIEHLDISTKKNYTDWWLKLGI
ncbi:MAG: hypothetical protein Q9M91_05710 [Candidatus Dojkabacteria bacterium]|nr:hypothetical protein [Candidatus Dojkabacteria bacterium]MDQ7021296.1 hypothetical protein [Candidatus Dojkabacteria bacterium]